MASIKFNTVKTSKYPFYISSFFCFYFSMGVFISTLSLFLLEKKLSTTNISFILAASAIFSIFTQPLIGVFADKTKNIKLVIKVSLCITLITGVLFVFTSNVIILFILNGLTQSLIIGLMPLFDNLAVNADYSYGSIRLWGSIGYAVSVQLCGLLFDYISHDSIFILFGVSTVISVFSVSRLKDYLYKSKKVSSAPSSISAIKHLSKSRPYLIFILLSFIILGMHYCNIAYMPILINALGGSATTVGSILLAQTVFEIPVLLIADKIVKRLSYQICLILITALSAIRYFWYSTMPSPTLIIAMFFFQALTTCLFFVVSIKLITNIINEAYVNTALSLSNMVGRGLGALSFQLGGGQLIEKFGVSTLYQFLGIMGMIGILVSLMFHVKKSSR